MSKLSENMQEFLSPILKTENANLVDIEIKGTTGNKTIKIFVDNSNGITLDKCETISRKFSDQLEIADIIPGKYRLEVSSPGVDRPMRTIQDFYRNINREILVTYENGTGENIFKGKIIDASNDIIQFEVKDEIKKIHVSQIIKSKISLPW